MLQEPVAAVSCFRPVEERQDLFLERHGDAKPVNGNFAYAGQQIVHRLDQQWQVNGIDVFPPHGGIDERRRQRMPHWIGDYSVDPGSGVELIDAIGFLHFAGGDLPLRGWLPLIWGGEGKGSPGANTQHAADHSLFAHADSHHGMVVFMFLHEVQHFHVVVQRRCRGDHLVKLGRECRHAGENSFPAPVVCLKSWNESSSEAFARSRSRSAVFKASALSTSRSRIWQPAPAALISTSISALSEP